MNKSLLGLSPVQQETAPLRRKIATALRKAIETGALVAGSRLVEKTLCGELNVSRTSLREALRELESEGLVTNGAKGLVVAAISIDEALNVYAVRGALEALLVEQFANRADDQALEDLDVTLAALTKAYKAGRIDGILAAKAVFYQALSDGADNYIVLEMLGRLNTRINQLRVTSLTVPKRAAVSIKELQDLVAALKRRDAAGAREIALRHIEGAAAAALGTGYRDKKQRASEGAAANA
jgi:DNA-binding GntR family transcriptional regulator